MDNDQFLANNQDSPGKLTLLSLTLSSFVTVTPIILLSLLLIDIGLTFGTPIGVTAQIQTVSSIVGIISALLMGVLSVRYQHKSLLMVGLIFIIISALGCAFAQNFNMLLLLFPLSGLGLGMVLPMCSALVGELFPIDKRSIALGGINAGAILSYVIGPRSIVYITGIGGWRLTFLVLVLPPLMVALLLVKIGLPHLSSMKQTEERKLIGGFKEIISKRSAVVCLIGVTLSVIPTVVGVTFGASFLREQFKMPSNSVTIVITIVALASMLGSLVCGRLVNRFGRKLLTVISVFLVAVFSIFFINIQNLWLSLTSYLLFGLFNGMRVTATQSLTLEQVPKFRGTMMSIYFGAVNLGSSLGAGVGGLVLLWYNWEIQAITLGGMGVFAALVFHLYNR